MEEKTDLREAGIVPVLIPLKEIDLD